MPIVIEPPWHVTDGNSFPFADTVFVSDRPTHSSLLGPDGKPLPYEKRKLGFDLRPATTKKRTISGA